MREWIVPAAAICKRSRKGKATGPLEHASKNIALSAFHGEQQPRAHASQASQPLLLYFSGSTILALQSTPQSTIYNPLFIVDLDDHCFPPSLLLLLVPTPSLDDGSLTRRSCLSAPQSPSPLHTLQLTGRNALPRLLVSIRRLREESIQGTKSAESFGRKGQKRHFQSLDIIIFI